MSDEKAVKLKRTASANAFQDFICICHYAHCPEKDIRPLSENQYGTLCEAVTVRQAQTSSGPRLDDICAQFPPTFNDLTHGCHRWCYKNFTNVSRLREKVSEISSANVPSRSSNRKPAAASIIQTLFPTNECIFCKRDHKYRAGNTTGETLVQCLTTMAEQTIKHCAHAKSDFELLGRIEGEDLIAKEAKYHESCRRNYTRLVTQNMNEST